MVVHGSLWVLQVTLPAGSTTFPLKLLPARRNWRFLMFPNDDINHLLFLFTLSETFGKAFLFLFPSSGCFAGTHTPLSWTGSLLSALPCCGMDWSEQQRATNISTSFSSSFCKKQVLNGKAVAQREEPGWQHLCQAARDRGRAGKWVPSASVPMLCPRHFDLTERGTSLWAEDLPTPASRTLNYHAASTFHGAIPNN